MTMGSDDTITLWADVIEFSLGGEVGLIGVLCVQARYFSVRRRAAERPMRGNFRPEVWQRLDVLLAGPGDIGAELLAALRLGKTGGVRLTPTHRERVVMTAPTPDAVVERLDALLIERVAMTAGTRNA